MPGEFGHLLPFPFGPKPVVRNPDYAVPSEHLHHHLGADYRVRAGHGGLFRPGHAPDGGDGRAEHRLLHAHRDGSLQSTGDAFLHRVHGRLLRIRDDPRRRFEL